MPSEKSSPLYSREKLIEIMKLLKPLLETGQLIIAYPPTDIESGSDSAFVDTAVCVCINGNCLQIDSLIREDEVP